MLMQRKNMVSDGGSDDIRDSEGDVDGEIRLETHKADYYRRVHSSSVRGGVQLQGDFLIDFLVDIYEDAGAEIYSIGGEGLERLKRREEYGNAVIQEKQVGVMMSQANAFNMATWVISNLLGEDVSEEDVETLLINEFDLLEED